MATLSNRCAIVTGGSSGIGAAIVRRFAEAEAAVAVLDVNEQGARQVVAEVDEAGGTAAFFACDVGDQNAVDRAFDAAADRFGSLDAVVNNAGVSHVGTVETTTEADLDRIYRVNVKGVYNGLRAAVRHMKSRGGCIVNMASIVSTAGIPDRFAYSMSKGAVLTMTYSVACDYLQAGIRCNSIAPARVHTPFVDDFLAENYPGEEQAMFDRLSATQPIGRMGTPEEVAELALYLCSDAASFVTGTNFPIDGGFLSLRP